MEQVIRVIEKPDKGYYQLLYITIQLLFIDYIAMEIMLYIYFVQYNHYYSVYSAIIIKTQWYFFLS